MVATRTIPTEVANTPEPEQRVFLHDVSWKDYKRISALRGESAIPRMTYLDGVLELMSPGTDHELDKKTLARLVEAYLDHLEIEATGYGSWTVRKKKKKGGAEADECYVLAALGPDDEPKQPDLVIEVMFSSGGLDKLEVWRRLGAKEVWFWDRTNGLRIFCREDGKLVPRDRGALVPAIDPALIVRAMGEASQSGAVRALRSALAAR